MRKPFFAYAKTKTKISFAVTAKLISAFVFATQIVQSLYYLHPKFQASSHLLCLYSLVCVGPGGNPEDGFSHNEARLARKVKAKKQKGIFFYIFQKSAECPRSVVAAWPTFPGSSLTTMLVSVGSLSTEVVKGTATTLRP